MAVLNFADMFDPQPRQRQLLEALNKYSWIFYGGARGGGKTAASVWVACLAGLQFPGLRIAVVRKTLDELRSQVIQNELLAKYPNGSFYTYKKSERTAYFHNGSTIYFRSIDDQDDAAKEQGIERGLYILDEGNKLEWSTIKKLAGSLRSPSIPNWKPTMIITGNPGGICDAEIKARFIKVDYSKWEPNELMLKDEFHFIPSTVHDNRYIDQNYINQLESMEEGLRRAWLLGDWDTFSGAFFTEWNESIHVVEEEFEIPREWAKWRAIDLGYGDHPSVCLFVAQNPDDGTLYVYNEVSTTKVTEIFIRMVADVSGDDDFIDTFFDPGSMHGRKDTMAQNSPAMMFLQEGIPVRAADNKREIGWRNLKQWLHWDENKPPMLKVFRRCTGLIETIPIQKYKDFKYDLDTKGRDDYVDALRYATSHILYGNLYTWDQTYEQLKLAKEKLLALPDRYANIVEPNQSVSSIYSNSIQSLRRRGPGKSPYSRF